MGGFWWPSRNLLYIAWGWGGGGGGYRSYLLFLHLIFLLLLYSPTVSALVTHLYRNKPLDKPPSLRPVLVLSRFRVNPKPEPKPPIKGGSSFSPVGPSRTAALITRHQALPVYNPVRLAPPSNHRFQKQQGRVRVMEVIYWVMQVGGREAPR